MKPLQSFIYRHGDQTRLEFVNGHYELGELKQTVVDDRNILYCLGSALLDNSCCGSFGCAYALVIGEQLAGLADAGAYPVREIDAEAPLAAHIRTNLLERETISVVNFYTPAQNAASGDLS